jgi:IclR family pca regulon transcriptional regulator
MKEASSAGVLDEGDVICIAATTAGRVVSSTLQAGTRVPAYCTANGRVLLSALPQAEVDAWIARQKLAPLTPNTVTTGERLRIEIARARAQGYAAVDQELELGLRTISVPLKSYRGEVLAAMNISVHAARVSMDQLVNDCLPALLQAQANLRTVL